MQNEPLFALECIHASLNATNKKQLLQEMAEMAVSCGACGTAGIKARDVVGAVMERERLGSTGVGYGVAIPHARLEGMDRVRAVFARLGTPMEYEAIDDRPVDLVVLLLAPLEAGAAHLKALAQVSRLLRRQEMRAKLRHAPGIESLHMLLRDEPAARAAQ